MRSKKIIVPFFCLIFATMTSSIRGENLSEVYELALKNDPLLRAAEASYRSGKENKACLLYTSPSPRDATLSRMPSSA